METIKRRFPLNKNPGLTNGNDIGCTDPTQATSRLLIVLLSRLPKSGCKEKQLTFSNGKGRFGPTDRNDWTGQSGPPSKVVLNIPVGKNQNGPLHLISY